MIVLGIETSCDETAAAVVQDGNKLLSNVVASSVDLHAAYGGVVPEIAARSHIESIISVIEKALTDAFGGESEEVRAKNRKSLTSNLKPLTSDPWDQIDAIAVTRGPGLGGSLLIGVLTARTLAIAKNKPLYGVNHVEAHVYATFLTEKANSSKLSAISLNDKQPSFPALALIVSGGHSQLVLFKNHGNYRLLGQTGDDAVGEAFDKVAKMLGLPYPGGPSVAEAAKKGDPTSVKLPIAKMGNIYDFSFSGLKTAVLRVSQELSGHDYTFPSTSLPQALSEAQKANIAASFQHTAVQTLIDNLKLAIKEFEPRSIVVGGGVAANQYLRQQIEKQVAQEVLYPDIKLCTDNAAMIAALGFYQASNKQPAADPCTLEIDSSLSM